MGADRGAGEAERPVAAGASCFNVGGATGSSSANPVLTRLTSRLRPFVGGLTSHFHTGALADVTLCADGVEFPCHRLALACSSEYFARMFEGPFVESQARPCIDLPGKSFEAVKAVLRVLYCDATVHEVLSEEPMRTLQVLELAREWLLPDVVNGCVEFVKREITDKGTLESLCMTMPFDEDLQQLRTLCHDRLRYLREAEHAKVASRGLQAAATVEPRDAHRGLLATSRWPTGCGSDQWSAPIQCPRGLGW